MQATTSRQRWFHTGGGEVLKSAAAFALMLSLAIFIYAAYHRYALRGRNEGDVVGEPQDPVAAGRRAAAVGHPAEAAPPGSSAPPAETPATAAGSGAQIASPGASPAPAGTSLPASATAPAAPATDTIAPNPPNGVAFGGTGHFQVYRQGDITWRLNTATGATCVLFATDAEWHQPRIRRAACR